MAVGDSSLAALIPVECEMAMATPKAATSIAIRGKFVLFIVLPCEVKTSPPSAFYESIAVVTREFSLSRCSFVLESKR